MPTDLMILLFQQMQAPHNLPQNILFFISVTLRDMGMILEHKCNEDKALKFYHVSLRYAVKFKNANNEQKASKRVVATMVRTQAVQRNLKITPRRRIGSTRTIPSMSHFR